MGDALRLPRRPLGLQVAIPPALPLDRLRDALHARHWPCTVARKGRDHVTITPGQGIPREGVAAFVAGFVAGFES